MLTDIRKATGKFNRQVTILMIGVIVKLCQKPTVRDSGMSEVPPREVRSAAVFEPNQEAEPSHDSVVPG
jgi:hypothetical protein